MDWKFPMKLNTLELNILNELSDDYESLSVISPEIQKALDRKIEKEEIVNTLKALAQSGYINVLKYNPVEQKYQKTEYATGVDFENFWFELTKEGRRERDCQWPESQKK